MKGCKHNIIPAKIESSYFRGDLKDYTEALYKIFKRDFIENDLFFENKTVDIIHEKYYDGKERSFWHIISEGEQDADRTPISRRAETLPWARALIEDKQSCNEYKKWKKYHDKTNRYRYYIWCSLINYMVILEDRDTYFKLITAFEVQEYSVRRYTKEYIKYKGK